MCWGARHGAGPVWGWTPSPVPHGSSPRSGPVIGTTLERGDQELSNDIKFIKIGPLLRKLYAKNVLFLLAPMGPAPVGTSPSWDQPRLVPARY